MGREVCSSGERKWKWLRIDSPAHAGMYLLDSAGDVNTSVQSTKSLGQRLRLLTRFQWIRTIRSHCPSSSGL